MMRIVFALIAALALANPSPVQAAQADRHLPRGAATDIPNSEIQTALQKTASAPVSDQQLRVVSINSEYNLGVGVVHRAKTAGREIGGGAEHSQITEIYHIISGNGTFVTGGTLQDAKDRAGPNALTGPSTDGSRIRGGHMRNVGPGDVIIIPPNTPHQFTEVTSGEIVYLVVRVDPHKVLPVSSTAK
jgi:mannose-6-phosphate isomerase-like protein (cupin superfamily)